LHRRGAGQHVFNGIAGGTHPAAADDRNLHGVRALIHHAQNDGFGRRPRQAAHDSAQSRTARMNIDRHGEHGVGNHQCIGAARLGRARQHGDIAHVGRELRPHRQRRRTLHGSDYLFGSFRIHGKGVAVFFEVGTRDVRFDGVDAGTEMRAASSPNCSTVSRRCSPPAGA